MSQAIKKEPPCGHRFEAITNTDVESQAIPKELPNGPAAAALIAGGLGSATIGLMTVLTEASETIKTALNWWNPAGPLTGKALVGVIVFFAAWFVQHLILRKRNVNFNLTATISLVLLGLGLLGTFPPFFTLFAAE